MKRLFLLAALSLFILGTFAQAVDLRRKIEVTGTADQEVTPDIINVSISLKEYMDGKNKTTIDVLERQLEKAVTDAGIPKTDLTITNVSAYTIYQKKKNPDFLAAKQYRIRFHDLNTYDIILSQIDPKGIQNTSVESYDYSKIDALKRDLKIKALQNAKEKATYLLGSIGDNLGNALDIEETDNETYPQPMYRSFAMAKMATTSAPAPDPSDLDVKKIKLSYQIRATFEIVK